MKNIIFLTFVLACSSANASQTITVQVNGMVCAFCAQGIEKKVRALPQVEDVYVNLKQKVVAVQVKEGQVLSTGTLTTLVKDAGYDVKQINTTDESTAALRARMEHE